MTSENRGLARLSLFLNVYGVVSVALFGGLFALTAIDAPLMQEGGALRFLRWDPLAKHIELMIEVVYLVWGLFFFRAAQRPLQHLSFIDFTIWANLAHGLLMVPQAFAIAGFHYKLLTDVAYCLGLSVGLMLLRPSGEERSPAPGAGAP
jgi:hypothetical protein